MKNITTLFLSFLSLVFLMTSCEKQEFKSDPGTPVFFADVPFFNDVGFDAVAGDDLYYMFASKQEQDDSYIHSGLFGKENTCTDDCAENFAIKFVNQKNSNKQLTVGEYEFYSIPKDGFKHNFSMQSNEANALNWTTWKLGNENFTGHQSVSFDSDNDAINQEAIQLSYNIPNQFLVQFDRPVLPRAVECDVELEIRRIPNLGVVLEVHTSSPFAFVSWSTGESGNRIRPNFETQTYTANIFDGSGCQTQLLIHFKTQNIVKDYAISLNQESVSFATPDNPPKSVIIEYTDGNGDFYTSSVIGQILPFEFVMNSIEEYEINELGLPTWKIEAEFNCILFGENGTTKRIKKGSATFAVSQ